MSVIEERKAEILRPQLKLIAQGRSRELDVPPEVGNRDRVSIRTTYESLESQSQPCTRSDVGDDGRIPPRCTHSLSSGFQLISVRVSEPHVLCTGRR